MTYTIKGRRAAQQDTTQPTQMMRQYSSGQMSLDVPATGPAGSPLTPYVGLKRSEKTRPLNYNGSGTQFR